MADPGLLLRMLTGQGVPADARAGGVFGGILPGVPIVIRGVPTTVGAALANAQPIDATLTALAGVSTSANKLIYATGADLFATADLSAFARTLIDDADAAAARATLGLATSSFRNRIINGNFRINQRGAPAVSTAYPAGTYIMDRWKAGANGVTLSFAAGVGDVTVTITAGTLLQVVEGAFYMPDNGVYMLSWKGTAQARVYQGGNPAYGVGPIATGFGGGINTTIEFGTGTVSQVQFELNGVATAFERRDDELSRCQRYFEVRNWTILDYNAAGKSSGQNVPFSEQKRVAPSIVLANTYRFNCSSETADGVNVEGFRLYTTALATGDVENGGRWAASAEL